MARTKPNKVVVGSNDVTVSTSVFHGHASVGLSVPGRQYGDVALLTKAQLAELITNLEAVHLTMVKEGLE